MAASTEARRFARRQLEFHVAAGHETLADEVGQVLRFPSGGIAQDLSHSFRHGTSVARRAHPKAGPHVVIEIADRDACYGHDLRSFRLHPTLCLRLQTMAGRISLPSVAQSPLGLQPLAAPTVSADPGVIGNIVHLHALRRFRLHTRRTVVPVVPCLRPVALPCPVRAPRTLSPPGKGVCSS